MYLSFESNELSALDLQILGVVYTNATAVASPTPGPRPLTSVQVAVEPVVTETPAPAKINGTPKPAKKVEPVKEEPVVEAEPEPVVEAEPEPVVEEPEEDLVGGAEPEPEGPTMADAVAAATKLVSSGGAPKVKEALAVVGAKRVSEIDPSQIQAFLTALDA